MKKFNFSYLNFPFRFSPFLIILFLSFIENSIPQSFISPGNRWDYIEGWWDGGGNGELDSNSYYAGNDTILQNGKTYQRIVPGNELFYNFFRLDTSGIRVFDFSCNDELLYFSYSAPIGEEYLVNCDTSQTYPKVVKTSDTVMTIFNEQERVISYTFDTGLDNSYSISVSPKFGFTHWYSWVPFGGNYFKILMGCIIDGTKYGELITGVYDVRTVSEFSLYQNYPNPFNPATIISYSIPEFSKVNIKVFDILGNEISTLVDEEKPAGEYDIRWNADDIPSGVYFYQLRAGSFISTKKMILLQ